MEEGISYADGPITQAPESGMETPPREEFDSTPEFDHFKKVMKRILAIPKSELDGKVKGAKKRSPRAGNPNAPGRKRRA
jgi:hypothetical protein